MNKKISNTFNKAADQLVKLEQVFAKDGKLEKAMMESDADIATLAEVRAAITEAINKIIPATLTEGVLDQDDEDGFMARSQLYFMAKDAIALHGMIGDRDNLEPWVQSKIAQAAQAMDSVRRYTEYNAMKTDAPEMEPQAEPEMMTTEASSSRMTREIEHLIQQVDSDMNMNRHYGDVDIAQVVQMVQAGDIEGAAEYVTGQYHDDDGGQNDGVLDGAYVDLVDDLKWITQNVNEGSQPSIEFGMFTPGGDAQIENGINHILRKFTDDAIAGTEGDRDALRMEAHKELLTMLEEMSEEEKYEEAMDTDVRERAAAYLEKGIVRVYNMLDKGRFMENMWGQGTLQGDGPHSQFMRSANADASRKRHMQGAKRKDRLAQKHAPKPGDFHSGVPSRTLVGQLADDVNEAEEKPYICVHAKKGKYECHAGSSYEAAKKAAAHWKLKSTAGIDAHLAVEETVNEGMEFDDKRNDDLKEIAKDMFEYAKKVAAKKVK